MSSRFKSSNNTLVSTLYTEGLDKVDSPLSSNNNLQYLGNTEKLRIYQEMFMVTKLVFKSSDAESHCLSWIELDSLYICLS